MKKITLFTILLCAFSSQLFAQTGSRILGAQQMVLDDNIFTDARIYFSNNTGSLGIDNSGTVNPGVFPSSCALLDLSSTTKGFLPPRMTSAQELLICGGTPPAGLVVYNTTTNTLDIYNGSSWGVVGWALNGNSLSGGSSSTPTQFFGSNNNYDVVFKTNGVERMRLGSSSASNLETITMPASASTGIQINGNAATSKGVSIDMTSNPVTSLGSSIYFGQITGANGVNVYGGNVNVFSNNAAATGFGTTTSVTGNGNTNAVFASATATGTGTINGVLGAATGTGAASGFLNGGTFFATGGSSSNQATGVSGSATSTSASSAIGGSFSAQGSTANNTAVLATATNATGTNTGIDAEVTGTNSLGMQIGNSSKPDQGFTVNANYTGGTINVTKLSSGNTGLNVNVSGSNGSGNTGIVTSLTAGVGSGPNNRALEIFINGSGPQGISGSLTNTTGVNTTVGANFLIQGGGGSNTIGYSADINGLGGGNNYGAYYSLFSATNNYGSFVWIFPNVLGTTNENVAYDANIQNAGGENIGSRVNITGTSVTAVGSKQLVAGGTTYNFGDSISVDGSAGQFAFGIEAKASGASIVNIGVDATASGASTVAVRGYSSEIGIMALNTLGDGTSEGFLNFRGNAGNQANGFHVQNYNSGTITNGVNVENAAGGSIGTGLLIQNTGGGTIPTAIQTSGGRMVYGNAGPSGVAAGGNIPSTAITVVVANNGLAASPTTAILPAGIEGQIIYITTSDPDGVTITVGANNVTIQSWQVGTFMYIGGQWRLSR